MPEVGVEEGVEPAAEDGPGVRFGVAGEVVAHEAVGGGGR